MKGARPGKWLLSAWMKSDLPSIDDPNYAAIVEVEWLDGQGKTLSKHRGAHLNGDTPVWAYREARADAPVGTEAARLNVRFSFSVCGACDVDDVALTLASEEDADGTRGSMALVVRPASRIFEPGEPVRVKATVPKGLGLPATFVGSLSDSRGRQLAEAEVVSLAEGSKARHAELTFPARELPADEWLDASVTASGPEVRGVGRVGVLVRARPTDFGTEADSPFALLVGHPYTMRWLGARWRRPNFNWNDREHELANRYGVTTLAMVNETTRALHGLMPIEEYAQYVGDSVGKYKGMLRWWQMGNEPPLFRPGMAEKYVEVLKAGYEAAKRANRDCIVAMGGLTGLNVDPNMLAKFLDAGGGKCCDVIDLHMYVPNPEMDQLLGRMRRDMAARGVEKPIILTEVTASLGKVLPEREKAGHVYKRFATALSHGVKQLYWFVMHWVNALPGGFQHCGLMDVKTAAPWPAAAAYARLSDALTGARLVRRQVTEDGKWLFQFRRGGQSVWVAWIESGPPRAVRVRCGEGRGKLIDVAGHEWAARVAGSLELTVTPEPILAILPVPSQDGPAGPAPVCFTPAEAQLARGGEIAVTPNVPPDSQIVFDTPRGLRVESTALLASPDAPTGPTTVWAFVRNGGVTTTALRLPVVVTEPLEVDVTPLPATVDRAAAARVKVRNLSQHVQAGELRVVSLLCQGLRPSLLQWRFTGLRAGETAHADLPLPGVPDPLGRYGLRAEARTDRGATASTARRLVFMAAKRFAKSPRIDAHLDEWGEPFPIGIGLRTGERSDAKDGAPTGAADLSARAQVRWDGEALYLAVRVRDDVHRNDRRDGAIWDGDGLQFGISSKPDAADAPRAELGCALTKDGPQTWIWRALPRAPTGNVAFPVAIVREQGETRYELAVPWRLLPGVSPRPGRWLGLALLVNEQDHANRGHYGWHGGVSHPKDPQRFGQITLVDR